jgi:hypothetical protein
MDARQLLLDSHSWVHSDVATSHIRWKIEDSICNGLTNEQIRHCPQQTHNSIAWLLWHMARCEDVAVNTVLRGVTEVLDREHWLARLGVIRRQIGTGETRADVRQFSEQVDVDALRAYRAAVGQETHSWMNNLDFAVLDSAVTCEDVQRAVERETFGEQAGWVIEYWERGWTRGEFLTWLTTGHNYFHLGEAYMTRGLVLLL